MNQKLLNLLSRVKNSLQRALLGDIKNELSRLEYHSFNRRMYAVEQCTEYLIGAQIDGDYAEFGVFQGTTFSYAYKWLSTYFKTMKFCAFDSFEGLPNPIGIDANNLYSSNFQAKQYSCGEPEFRENIQKNGVDLGKVRIVNGWFNKTLTSETAKSIGLSKIALAWIDCDLYESTVPVLDFLAPLLSTGSVIIFDDWRCFRNDPEYGEQRACSEWLQRNPNLRLRELLSFGWNGIAFSVNKKEEH